MLTGGVAVAGEPCGGEDRGQHREHRSWGKRTLVPLTELSGDCCLVADFETFFLICTSGLMCQ